MLISKAYIKRIYVSIASFMDKELLDTVDDILKKAKYPKRLFISVVSQDRKEDHPDLQPIFDKYGIKDFKYEKVSHLESIGVCWARNKALESLNPSYSYFLQVDSHSQFVDNWDTKIISDYERLAPAWGSYIFSSYPKSYLRDNNWKVTLEEDVSNPVVNIVENPDAPVLPFEAKYCDYFGGHNGQYTGYFCGGQTFGPAKYFMEIKPDPSIYFQGEEHTLSIRFYEAGIKIVCPPRSYVYHNYEGNLRQRHWDALKDWEPISDRSEAYVLDFINNRLSKYNKYALKNPNTYTDWYSAHVVKA